MKETDPISIALKLSPPRKTGLNAVLGKHREIPGASGPYIPIIPSLIQPCPFVKIGLLQKNV